MFNRDSFVKVIISLGAIIVFDNVVHANDFMNGQANISNKVAQLNGSNVPAGGADLPNLQDWLKQREAQKEAEVQAIAPLTYSQLMAELSPTDGGKYNRKRYEEWAAEDLPRLLTRVNASPEQRTKTRNEFDIDFRAWMEAANRKLCNWGSSKWDFRVTMPASGEFNREDSSCGNITEEQCKQIHGEWRWHIIEKSDCYLPQ